MQRICLYDPESGKIYAYCPPEQDIDKIKDRYRGCKEIALDVEITKRTAGTYYIDPVTLEHKKI